MVAPWTLVRGRLSGRQRLSGSVRLRVVRLLWEVSPGVAIVLGLFILADGFLPNLAVVALGASTGRIPAAVAHGLGSAPGRALLVSLTIGAAAYALSLIRTPVQDLLQAYCSAVMRTRAWHTAPVVKAQQA